MTSSARAAPLWSSIVLAVLLVGYVEAHPGPSIPMTYCASINTAGTTTNSSIYQSDGLCYNFCKASWALAIVQDDSCWCSNYVPDAASQVSTSQCDKACPGYPYDVCGGDGLFGYMLLEEQPSGTASDTVASSTSTSSSARVTTTETVQNTVTYIPPSSSTTSSTASSTTSSSESSTTSSSSQSTDSSTATVDSTSTTQTPTVSTLTAGGQTKTVTVTPPPTSVASNSGSLSLTSTPSPASHHGLSTGATAGIAVAVVGAFLLAGGVVVWLWIKRRRARRDEAAGPNFSSNRGSSAGMTSTPRTGEMSESRYYMGAENPPEPMRRRSTLMPVDPRLDPFAKGIYSRPENKSHDSVNTIYDEQDYSRRIQEPPRVLRAVNPDSDID